MTTEEKHALLRERLHALNIVCGGDATGKLIRYQELLETWNARINLTGAAAFDALLDKHLMDSLTPLTVDGLLPENATVIDVGSGAGLPGIPLAIVRSDLRMTLLDSMQKRIGFLNTVIETLGLTNVTATHARAEDAAHDEQYREQFDIAIARAVAALPVLEELLLPFVRIGGKIVCYKGPSVKEELEAGAVAAELLGGGLPEGIAVSVPFLPQHRHTLTVTKKLRLTLKRYPRKAGTPAKNPLGS